MTKTIRQPRIVGNLAYIPLTQGYETVINVSDLPVAEGFNWRVAKIGRSTYALRINPLDPKRGSIRLHRAIMGEPEGLEVDHIDGDGLNNRRENLRLATRAENMRNRKTPSNNTSGFKGVIRVEWRKKWQARIVLNGKRKQLGYFDTPQDAHKAYCDGAKAIHGEFWSGG